MGDRKSTRNKWCRSFFCNEFSLVTLSIFPFQEIHEKSSPPNTITSWLNVVPYASLAMDEMATTEPFCGPPGRVQRSFCLPTYLKQEFVGKKNCVNGGKNVLKKGENYGSHRGKDRKHFTEIRPILQQKCRSSTSNKCTRKKSLRPRTLNFSWKPDTTNHQGGNILGDRYVLSRPRWNLEENRLLPYLWQVANPGVIVTQNGIRK